MSSKTRGTWNDLHVVLLISGGLGGCLLITYAVHDFVLESPDPSAPDIDYDFARKFPKVARVTGQWFIAASIITNPLAIYFTAKNDGISRQIRMLAITESVNRLVYSIIFVLNWFFVWPCYYYDYECVGFFPAAINFLDGYLVEGWNLLSISLVFQVFISLHRFLALSFDGIYYRHARKWPFAQVVLGHLIGLALYYVKVSEQWLTYGEYETEIPLSWIIWGFIWFTMFGMDIVTNQNLKKRKREGKATQVEQLLMIQMLLSSSCNILSSLGFFAIDCIIRLFFGPALFNVFESIVVYSQPIIRDFIASFLMIIFLRKRKPTVEAVEAIHVKPIR